MFSLHLGLIFSPFFSLSLSPLRLKVQPWMGSDFDSCLIGDSSLLLISLFGILGSDPLEGFLIWVISFKQPAHEESRVRVSIVRRGMCF